MRILRVDIGEDDPEPMSERGYQSTSQSFSPPVIQSVRDLTKGKGDEDERDNAPSEFKCGRASDSRRSTGDDGDATALESRVSSGIEGGENLCKGQDRRGRCAQANEVRASDRGMREGLGRLCWAPAAPNRPLCKSAHLGAAKRDGSGT